MESNQSTCWSWLENKAEPDKGSREQDSLMSADLMVKCGAQSRTGRLYLVRLDGKELGEVTGTVISERAFPGTYS